LAILQLDPDDDDAEDEAQQRIIRQHMADLRERMRQQGRIVLRDVVNDATARAMLDELPDRVWENREELQATLSRMLIESVEVGVNNAGTVIENGNLGISVNYDLANEFARQWAQDHVGELISGINETTTRNVRRLTQEWIASGEALPALRRRLEPTFGSVRADMIATTEVTRAYAEGNINLWQTNGLVPARPGTVPPAHPRCRCWLVLEYDESTNLFYYVWRTAVDERVCPICLPLDGTRV